MQTDTVFFSHMKEKQTFKFKMVFETIHETFLEELYLLHKNAIDIINLIEDQNNENIPDDVKTYRFYIKGKVRKLMVAEMDYINYMKNKKGRAGLYKDIKKKSKLFKKNKERFAEFATIIKHKSENFKKEYIEIKEKVENITCNREQQAVCLIYLYLILGICTLGSLYTAVAYEESDYIYSLITYMKKYDMPISNYKDANQICFILENTV